MKRPATTWFQNDRIVDMLPKDGEMLLSRPCKFLTNELQTRHGQGIPTVSVLITLKMDERKYVIISQQLRSTHCDKILLKDIVHKYLQIGGSGNQLESINLMTIVTTELLRPLTTQQTLQNTQQTLRADSHRALFKTRGAPSNTTRSTIPPVNPFVASL